MARDLALLLALSLPAAHGHGAMVQPAPRQSADAQGAPIAPDADETQCQSAHPYSQAGFYPGEYCTAAGVPAGACSRRTPRITLRGEGARNARVRSPSRGAGYRRAPRCASRSPP